MDHIFCTLFNSNYLDKGIALYNSLKKYCNNFKLYIFAFDDLTYDVLNDLNFPNVIVVHLSQIENEELLYVKKSRSSAEYCWTCTPATIMYVLKHFHESICTYLDADMFFYQDPSKIFDEMNNNSNSIIIVRHNFPKKREKLMNQIHGKYCVEFNTFKNNEKGMECLEWWRKSCLNECHYSRNPKDTVGDQTYLEEFETRFSEVQVCSYLGAGVAPWNIMNYKMKLANNGELIMQPKDNKKMIENVIFFHFQGIKYLPFGLINIDSQTNSSFVKKNIYLPYLLLIDDIRKMLYRKYNITFSKKKNISNNWLLGTIQNYIKPFYIKHFNNIIKIKRRNYDTL